MTTTWAPRFAAPRFYLSAHLLPGLSLELPPFMHMPAEKPPAAKARIPRTYRCASHAGIRHACARDQSAQRAQYYCTDQRPRSIRAGPCD